MQTSRQSDKPWIDCNNIEKRAFTRLRNVGRVLPVFVVVHFSSFVRLLFSVAALPLAEHLTLCKRGTSHVTCSSRLLLNARKLTIVFVTSVSFNEHALSFVTAVFSVSIIILLRYSIDKLTLSKLVVSKTVTAQIMTD